MFFFKSLLLTKPAFILSKVQQKQYNLEIFLLFKISVCNLNIFLNVIHSCDFKTEFLASLLQSHDSSEILRIFKFGSKNKNIYYNYDYDD